MCELNFIPESCGFTDCEYTWNRIKIQNNVYVKIVNQKIEKVGDLFRYFPPAANGTAKWTQLKILTKRVDLDYKGLNIFATCGLCKEDLDETCKELDCKHSYHTECLDRCSFIYNQKCVLCRL